MTEEEKKAVEDIKRELSDEERKEYMSSWFAKDLDIAVNLIEKLQKENEELKKLMAHKNGYTKKLEEDLFENASNYVIPKKKIKELIKRKKENIEGLHPASDCMLIDDFETQIDVLEQLLEEDNYDE